MQNPFNPVQQLLSLHSQGRFVEMEARARQLLRGNGNAPILNELLGVALSGQKKFRDALPYLQKAARREPNDALFWENLALCQRELGEYAHAEKSLRQSLKLRPGNVEALNALGSVLRNQERIAEARQAFEQALTIAPNHGPAHFNLGKLLSGERRWSDAERHLRNAIQINPPNAMAHRLLGRILLGRGSLIEAEQHFRRAAELVPDDYANFAWLAIVTYSLGRSDAARQLVQRTFEKLGGIGEKLSVDTIEDLDFFARGLTDMGYWTDALRIFEVLIPFDRKHCRAWIAAHVARQLCDWRRAAEFEDATLDFDDHFSGAAVGPFVTLSLIGATSARQRVIASRFADEYIDQSASVISTQGQPKARRERLRIGYLSSDFYDHATSFLIAGVIEAHDRSRYELFAYDYSRLTAGAYRERMKRAFDTFRPVLNIGGEAAARQIAEDGIDIAIDLKGWTGGTWTQILISRPAALQAQWLGYPGTLGAPWIDYIVADRILIRPGEEDFYSEKVLALPDCYQPNDDKRETPGPCPRADCGLPKDSFVFGCFNRSYKITPKIFDVWMRLLDSKPDSVLWLLASENEAMENLQREATARGVAPERLVFAPIVSPSAHLARAANIDLALDCFPYNSHTTASDMLWAGVPMVGLSGDTFASRVSESILRAAGLPDLATCSYDDYFDLAARLAGDANELANVKARVRACKRSVLFDTKRFTRALECGFELMWERHQRGLPPDHIDVPPVA